MKLLNEEEMSCWAYTQCKIGNNTKEIKNLITHSYWAYMYCLNLKDLPEMWPKIKDNHAFLYCQLIKKRDEIKQNILNDKWAYFYCLYVEDDPEIRKRITSNKWSYFYCKNVKDIPEIRKNVRISRLSRWYKSRLIKYYCITRKLHYYN